MILAFVAVPHVVFIQRFLLLESPQTVIDVNSSVILAFLPAFVGALWHSGGQKSVQAFIDVLVPNHLDLDLTSPDFPVLSKHGVVARNFEFFKQVLEGDGVCKWHLTSLAVPLLTVGAIFAVADLNNEFESVGLISKFEIIHRF